MSNSNHPTERRDSRRGAGKCPSWTIFQIDERPRPTRLETSKMRNIRGAAGSAVRTGLVDAVGSQSAIMPTASS